MFEVEDQKLRNIFDSKKQFSPRQIEMFDINFDNEVTKKEFITRYVSLFQERSDLQKALNSNESGRLLKNTLDGAAIDFFFFFFFKICVFKDF